VADRETGGAVRGVGAAGEGDSSQFEGVIAMTQHPQGWPLLSLGELTDNFDSIRVPVKEAERKPGPYPYYGASGIVDWVDRHLFEGEYMLIAEDGENLRTRQPPVAFMATGKFWVNNHAHIVRGNKKSNTRYLMYALWQADISGYLTGSTMPKLTQGNLNRILVPAPPLHIQEEIARILGSLDDKIDLNRRTNETLEAMARTLFRSWFVDFDPVRAKVEGRTPEGMDAATAKLFPAAFAESALGPVPKGWRVGTISEIAEANAWTLGKNDPLGGLDYIEISEVNRGGIGTIIRYIRGAEPSRARRRLRHGDTILSTVRPDRGLSFWLSIRRKRLSPQPASQFSLHVPRTGHSSMRV
jgi:restriction endonuclease S subunit